MSRTHVIPPQHSLLEERRAISAGLGLLLGTPIGFGIVALCLRFRLRDLSLNDFRLFAITLIPPAIALWVRATTLRSLRIELEENRLTRIQKHPLTRSPQRLSFTREDVAHIREIPKQGLMVHGRNSKGRYLDLEVPRSLENYDDLRSRLAAWQPIHESWL